MKQLELTEKELLEMGFTCGHEERCALDVMYYIDNRKYAPDTSLRGMDIRFNISDKEWSIVTWGDHEVRLELSILSIHELMIVLSALRFDYDLLF